MWFALGGCWLDGRVYRRHPDHVRLDRRELIKKGRKFTEEFPFTLFRSREYNSIATIEVQADMTPVHLVENQTERVRPRIRNSAKPKLRLFYGRG